MCHPPCEDVDWNRIRSSPHHHNVCHPPCEDVDWNFFHDYVLLYWLMSSSVRGCGLKSTFFRTYHIAMGVILRARMWIEITTVRPPNNRLIVILRARMWIEIVSRPSASTRYPGHPPCEDVDWNAYATCWVSDNPGHPPCEDVDWNE